MKINKKII